MCDLTWGGACRLHLRECTHHFTVGMLVHCVCKVQYIAKNSTWAFVAKSCLSVGPSQAGDTIVEKLVLPVYHHLHYGLLFFFFFFFAKLPQREIISCYTLVATAVETKSVQQTLSSHRASTKPPLSSTNKQSEAEKKSIKIYSDWDYTEKPHIPSNCTKCHMERADLLTQERFVSILIKLLTGV